jgi:pimeloyl-ACP methyl ester carboxylesterase
VDDEAGWQVLNRLLLIMILPTALTRCILAACLVACLGSCTYLRYASVQAEYERIQNAEPGQLNAKHMLDTESFVIHGQCNDATGNYAGLPKVIVAFSSKYQPNEQVAMMYFEMAGSHYGMSLPGGHYDLRVFADIDGDGIFGRSEVVGHRTVELNEATVPGTVLGQMDVRLTEPTTLDWDITIEVPDTKGRGRSVFYPEGTLRTLDDPIFDPAFSTLGMYDPASFLEQAPTMFYALEDDLGFKIPVIFVHGINGSARQFAPLVARLDRQHYKAWFFHYPSGGDLDQMAELFYQIFLSGKVYDAKGMPIIVVAHSMGGLVVREAINRYAGKSRENEVHLLVTMATPFNGHAAAAKGEEHGFIVLPSWRDLNPDNGFIRNLFRKPLPDFVRHELIFSYQNPNAVKLGENSDGVVALSSQLRPDAQAQASATFGFDNSHADILESEDVATHLESLMARVKNPVPAPQLEVLNQGGFDVALSDAYSPKARYLIHNIGIYLMALTEGRFEPFYDEEERFMAVVNGEKSPRSDIEKGWLRFLAEHPEFRD